MDGGVGRERLSAWKSEKERIPNLPKSLANPVSPCSLIPLYSQCELQEKDGGYIWRCIRGQWGGGVGGAILEKGLG